MQQEDEHEHDLFNNPMVKAAMDAMPESEKKRYKIIGEEMYGNVNFEESKILNNIPEPMKEFLLYITEQLKSGIHPSDLEDSEKDFLKDAFGNEWYIKYGYVEEDLYSIKTLVIN